jgi:hypothetical protein
VSPVDPAYYVGATSLQHRDLRSTLLELQRNVVRTGG